MKKEIRKLLSTIAHEAHIMGRIYNKLGEKENPAEVYNKIEKMVEYKLQHHQGRVEDEIKKIIVEILDVDPNEVVPEASFVDDIGADSLDLVELIMSMEEKFDIDINDEDAEKIITVKDARDYVERMKGSR